MKKKEIRPALEALKKIKMPAIEDKALRNGVITTHLALLKEQRKYEKEIADYEEAHLGSYAEEREELGKIQREMAATKDREKREDLAKKYNSHTGLFDAWEAFNKAADALGDECVDVPTIPQDAFIEQIQKQDFDLGQIEALYPLFE